MTIASAFNDIAVAQGGTAAKSGAITAAIDALNDALAGSDQPQAKTIEQAVRLLGEHIGGGGGGTEYNIKCATIQGGQPVEVEDCVGISIWNDVWEYASETSNKAQAGEVIKLTLAASYNMQLVGVFGTGDDPVIFPFDSEEGSFTMPKSDVYAIVQAL